MSYKVLVVDDNINNSRLIEGILETEENGYSCIFAMDGLDGYEQARKEIPDLILMDMMMPKLNGMDSMKMIRQHEDLVDIPIIFITAYKTNEIFNEAFQEGAIDFISKPIDINELRSRVNKALSIGESLKRIRIKINKLENSLDDKTSLLTQNSQNSFIILDDKGRLEWANDGFKTLHGLSLKEFQESDVITLAELYSNQEVDAIIEKFLNDFIPISFTAKVILPNGDLKWLQSFMSSQFNTDEKINKITVIEFDISEIKNKEHNLSVQNKRMLQITSNLENANLTLEQQKREIEEQKQIIEDEKEKSERLLLNILPFEVARQLKSKGKAGTRFYKHVSVLFTDFKGFSQLSKKFDPKDLVSNLDTYFAQFDEITGNHYLEKIKTIGDAYMCAGGLPLRNKSNPVDSVLAGLEIQNYMNKLNDEKVLKNEPVWELRIGVHTGSVVAGVVGKKKFAYDIWGETVNIASRMENMGHVGMVNISGDTYDLVKDYFECVYRGKFEAKNVGMIDMYFVNRIKPEYAEDKLGFSPNEELIRTVSRL